MKNIFLFALCAFSTLISSCSKDGFVDGISNDVALNLTADSYSVYAGEDVTFSFDYKASSLALYTGDEGHEYENSYYVVMDGVSEEQLRDEVNLREDDSTEKYEFSLADYTAADYSMLTTSFDYTRKNGDGGTPFNAPSGLGSDGKTIDDGGKTVFETSEDYSSAVTYWNDRYIHFKGINQAINDNKTLVVRMKYKGIKDASKRVQAVVNVVGRESVDDAPRYNKTEYYLLYDYPSSSYKDYKFDLTNVIADWEARTTKKLNYIDELVIMFRDFDGVETIGGKKYGANITGYCIESMSYSGVCYFPLSSGHSVSTSNSSGVATYQYAYDKAGAYNIVGVAVSNGNKVTKQITIEVVSRDNSSGNSGMDGDSGDWDADDNSSSGHTDMGNDTGDWNQ